MKNSGNYNISNPTPLSFRIDDRRKANSKCDFYREKQIDIERSLIEKKKKKKEKEREEKGKRGKKGREK